MAKLKPTKDNKIAQNISVTELPEKELQVDNLDLQLNAQQQRITNPEFKHHVGRSVNHMNNMVLKEAILAAAESSDDQLIT